MDSFTVNRGLLNPKFEGYKLDLIEDAVSRYPLSNHLTQSTVSGFADIPLSFPEMRSRITHNHLTISLNAGLYVDADYKIIQIKIESDRPVFNVLYELPRPVGHPSNDGRHAEYPYAAFSLKNVIVATDGHGLLYILQEEPSTSTYLATGTYVLQEDKVPFKIHNLVNLPNNSLVAVLSARHYTPPPHAVKHNHSTEFDIFGVILPLTPTSTIPTLDVLWHRRGTDVPLGVYHSPEHNSLLLLGGAMYPPVGAPQPPTYEPTPDEIAPIPRADEMLDVEVVPKPPPYSWTQTDEGLTVAFPLPSSISKDDIKITFSVSSLSLAVVRMTTETTEIPFPNYEGKILWDSIAPSSSYWTWDKEDSQTLGLLTLHLDKQQEGRKWMHVFSSANQVIEEDVPETLDPSELWKVRESLEKYTRSLQTGEDSSGLGLGTGVPSLADGEMDMDVDADVGRPAYVTWVPTSDQPIPPTAPAPLTMPINVLSTPIPGWESDNISVIIRENIDGPQFILSSNEKGSPMWKHDHSFSALSFVIASKQDTRFVYHLHSKAVLVFESAVADRGGNLYIYRAAPKASLWAKQSILKIGEAAGGALLGVGMLGGTVLCLFETELVLIENVKW